jgi:hypothetical protein
VAKIVYFLCTVTAVASAWLLLRAYLQTRARLLLWSAMCFGGLAANNVLLVLDRLVLTTQDLSTWRLGIALVSVLLLVTGLILEGDR